MEPQFPVLYHKGKNGELRSWSVWTEGDEIVTDYGLVDGQRQRSRKRAEAKNVGRSNATTPEQQAELEAKAMHTFKLERKYSMTPSEAALPLMLPMLAHKYDSKKHEGRVWLGQFKLDGTRCLAMWQGSQVVLLSRQGKIYNVPHVSEALQSILGKDDVFDGELYVHGKPLQTIISMVKKYTDASLELEYHVYDMPTVNGVEDLPFSARLGELTNVAKGNQSTSVLFVSTYQVGGEIGCPTKDENVLWSPSPEDFEAFCVKEGFEGAILRDPDGLYEWGFRSKSLLKLKSFIDDEFTVISVGDGRGKMEGRAVFRCRNNINDLEFDVAPKATMAQRKAYFDNADAYIGKPYTVRYFDRTNDGLPRFPVGIAFQEDR